LIKAALVGLLFLTGCASIEEQASEIIEEPRIQDNPMQVELSNVPALNGPKMTIGVYSFTDKTGQREPADNFSSLSSAVTQGAEVWVIDALMQAGNGSWFEVVERVGMDNVIAERQLIRQTRENYLDNPDPLDPMQFAGLILEGGIVGYYRVDTVTVAMRLVSVSTGRVLISVATEKTIASHKTGADVFKFLDMSTKALEIESGFSVNEPTNYAVRAAIEAGIIELIYEGARRELWSFK
jgi:curli production assembly/transport component CsgG